LARRGLYYRPGRLRPDPLRGENCSCAGFDRGLLGVAPGIQTRIIRSSCPYSCARTPERTPSGCAGSKRTRIRRLVVVDCVRVWQLRHSQQSLRGLNNWPAPESTPRLAFSEPPYHYLSDSYFCTTPGVSRSHPSEIRVHSCFSFVLIAFAFWLCSVANTTRIVLFAAPFDPIRGPRALRGFWLAGEIIYFPSVESTC